MKLVYTLVLLSLVGIIIPAYAQDPRVNEVDQQMIEETKACKAEIDSNENLSDAEKTVAKRNCEREISIRYNDIDINYQAQGELRAKIQDMKRCEDWYPQYRYLTMEQFQIQKNADIVSKCVTMYNDPIWNYEGNDRLEKLLDRYEEIKGELPNIPEPSPIAIEIELPQYESSIVDIPQSTDRVTELEEKVKQLEEEITRKDQVIQEQVKVIMDLFNKIKNVVFEPVEFLWSIA